MKKRIIALLMALVVTALPCVALAAEPGEPDGGTPAETPSETPEDDALAESIVNNTNRPFLALGNDLSEEQLEIVLSEMGIAKEDLTNYDIVYITNDMEHKYLDSYIDPAVIGSYSLSCVMIKENTSGGIRVTTRNINYCTINMYKNALLTAGVENADVLVVGPFPISGTAALIGAWSAYEEMTGETLDEDRKTAALAEMITIGDLTDGESEEDNAKMQDLIDYVKAEVIANGLTSIDEIREAINQAQKQFNITLTEDEINAIIAIMQKIASLDIDPSKLLEQAGDLYNKYGDTILADAKAALDGIFTDEVKTSLWDSIKAFFETLFEAIVNFFSN